eukprot:Gb_03000 [translate_table: standard]
MPLKVPGLIPLQIGVSSSVFTLNLGLADQAFEIFCYKLWNGVSFECWESSESPSLPLKLPDSMAVTGASLTCGFVLGSISAPVRLSSGKFCCFWRLPGSMWR